MRPFKTTHTVTVTKKPSLDAWYGAKELAKNPAQLKKTLITRNDYEEKGAEYLKQFQSSNIFHQTPSAASVD